MQTLRNLNSCLLIAGLIAVFCSTGEAQTGDLQSDLILRFRFEGSGSVAADASGNGNDGTIVGAQRVAGRYGKGLAVGKQDEFVRISNVLTPACTIEFWFKPNWDGSETETYRLFDANTGAIYYMIGKGKTPGDRDQTFGFYLEDAADADFQDWETPATDAIPAAGQWYHLATTWDFDAGEAKFYINGEEVGSITGLGNFPPLNPNPTIGFNTDAGYMGATNGADGIIDEFAIYARALTAEEIQVVMRGAGDYPWAYGPNPKDATVINDTWVNLTWAAGDFAVSHDVYLGDNLDNVNNATADSPVFRGNQGDTFTIAGFAGFPYPDGLVPGTTYYWRIDEVNDTEPNSPWKGEIWSFSIPPKTAYSPDPADGAEFVEPGTVFTWTPGFGAKLHTVYMGTSFDEVSNATGGAPAGSASYSPAALESEKVYYWRVDEFDPPFTHKGDVWSFTTPGAVGNPQPANGAVDVQMIATVNWTPADNATSHELYFGTDPDAVDNATTASPEYVGPRALGAESYDPGGLAWDSGYAWRVDEVYPTETVKGLVWSFTTADFIAVDDFEAYNDVDPPDPNSNTIYSSWIDGYGIPTNGAITANELPPYAEQTTVHGGAQSMKYLYDTNLMISESTLTLVYPKNWTAEGVTKLSLWFRGASANAADRMFVALGNAVVYHDDPAATQITGWTEWVIELQGFADQGVDLSSVSTITIGFGTKNSPAAGGTGQMYFDDIRLYR
ncbi:MAG: LamG domain-containing protein [Phycisphaerae bacterium]|nr:LamG domain-containing protein [Phycisphaerae bacterium]